MKQALCAYAMIVYWSASGCAVGLRDGVDDGGAPDDATAPSDAARDAMSRDSAAHDDAVAPGDSAAPIDSGASDSSASDSGSGPGDTGAFDSTMPPTDASSPTDAFVEDGNLPPNATAGSCDPFAWTASALSSLTVTGPDGGPLVVTPPSYAIDGLQPSRWTTGVPQDNPNLYYQLDFGGYVWVSSLTVDNHYYSVTDTPQAFDVAAANDGVGFSDYRSLIDGGISEPLEGGPSVTVTFPRQATRYLRIQITSANQSTKWWSMEELHVGCEVPDSGVTGGVTPPPSPIVQDGSGVPPTTGMNPNRANWTATAWPNLSTISGDAVFANAFDDMSSGGPNLTTRWSDGTAMNGDEYFVLNLGRSVALTWITLTSNSGGAISDNVRAWEIQFSSDGTTWTPGPQATPPGPEGVNGGLNTTALAVTQISLPPTSAQYVRINQLGASGEWWSLYDITVYGQ